MITIVVTGYNDKPITHPISADFHDSGGTIGRSPENTLALLDPERKISRVHASLSCIAGRFVIRDQGSMAPVVLNGQSLGNGREAAIAPGDEIRIAGYVMSVRPHADAQTASQAVADAPKPAVAEPSAPEVAALRESPSEAEPAQPVVASPVATAEPVAESPPQSADGSAAYQNPIQPEPELPGPETQPETAEAAVAEQDAVAKPEMSEPVLSWLSTEGSGAVDVTTIILAPTGHSFAEHHASPSIQEPSTGTKPPVAATASAGGDSKMDRPVAVESSSNEELLRALLGGTGLNRVDFPGDLTPELMKKLGQVLREATGGLVDLLAARAQTKRDVRADMTVIVASDNNPLKFSPDHEAALTHLLAPRGRGFMPPLRAVTDAYDDLRAHQLGFMAGMRSALAVVLARFDPHALEERLTGKTMVDSILPTHRKAKLWDLFGQLYGTISKDAQSDFHTLFAHEFLRAYKAHVAKIPEKGDAASKR